MPPKKYAVIDTAPIIRGANLEQLAVRDGLTLITVPEVIKEIRDAQTRARLDAFLVPIELKEPSDEAFAAVRAFSRLTGDFSVLSRVDLRCLALTWMLERETKGGVDHLRTKPIPLVIATPEEQAAQHRNAFAAIPKDEPIIVAVVNDNDKEGQSTTKEVTGSGQGDSTINTTSADSLKESSKETVEEEKKFKSDEEDENENEQDEDDDDSDSGSSDGWITQDNIAQFGAPKAPLPETFTVGLVTGDFAMQNVALQMGLRLLSLDGSVIKQLRHWILRCHACFALSREMDRVFCESCGNATMQRISAEVGEDGKLILGTRRPPPLRGTRYTIAPAKGGRHNNDIILREDELMERQRKMGGYLKAHKKEDDPFSPDYGMFGGRRRDDSRVLHAGPSKKNPNESKRRLGKKKKHT